MPCFIRLIASWPRRTDSKALTITALVSGDTSSSAIASSNLDVVEAGPVYYRYRHGMVMHLDHNAAMNILGRGLAAAPKAARRFRKPSLVIGCFGL